MPARVKTTRFTVAGGGVSLAAAACWALMRRPSIHGIDDANIFMAYGRSLAHGAGFVFTPGGDRVEGFTSMLWTLVAALAWKLPGGGETELLIASLVLCMATVFMVGWVADAATEGLASPPGGWGGWTAAALLLFYPLFVAWTTLTLMDLVAWIFATQLMLVGLVLTTREEATARASALLVTAVALCVLARPEALAVVPAMLLLGILVHPGGLRRGAVALAPGILAFLLTEAALTGFRLSYFGYPFPNTYYAKVPPALGYRLYQGGRYIAHGLFRRPELTAAVLLAARAVTLAPGRFGREPLPRRQRAVALTAGTALALLAVVVVGGGDHFRDYRFLQPAVPPLLVVLVASLAAGGLGRLRMTHGSRLSAAFAALLALSVATAYWDNFRDTQDLRREMDIARHGRELAAGMNTVLTSHPSVGVIAVGGFGLTYRGTTRDLLGLNWVAMGHSPGDRRGPRDHTAFSASVFWTAPPDVMLPEFQPDGGGCPPQTLYLRGLESSERFRRVYTPGVFDTAYGRINAYFARTWIDRAAEPVRLMGWEHCGP